MTNLPILDLFNPGFFRLRTWLNFYFISLKFLNALQIYINLIFHLEIYILFNRQDVDRQRWRFDGLAVLRFGAFVSNLFIEFFWLNFVSFWSRTSINERSTLWNWMLQHSNSFKHTAHCFLVIHSHDHIIFCTSI